MTIKLNDQQAAGLEKVVAWYRTPERETAPLEPLGFRPSGFGADVFTWFGYAGTGKTFTAARIPEALGLRSVVFGTYTGKAASVLRRSLERYGAPYEVSTIHSAIYKPTTSRAAKEALELARDELSALDSGIEAEDGPALDLVKRRDELEAQLPALEAAAKRLRFEFNPESEWAYADLIILDEVSMVDAKLAADIESFGVPILVLGDPAQLPPVEGGGYYTERTPDVLLTRIERQAIEGSPVINLATRVRESRDGTLGLTPRDMRKRSLAEAMEADMVLVWTNKRRWSMIKAIRAKLDRPEGRPVPGDVVMNLTNNKDMAVFNGQTWTVQEVRRAAGTPRSVDQIGWDLVVVDDDGQVRDLPVWADGFLGQEGQAAAKNGNLGARGERALVTFAQAITVHKAQGSEANRVYVVNETPGMIAMGERTGSRRDALAQARRWLYTACTRAREQVVITRPQ